MPKKKKKKDKIRSTHFPLITVRSSYLGCRWWVAAGEKSRCCRSHQYNSQWHTARQLDAWCGRGGVWRSTEAPARDVSCSPVTLALVLPSPALVTSSTAIYIVHGSNIFNSNYTHLLLKPLKLILSDYWPCQKSFSGGCLIDTVSQQQLNWT